eukprot:gene57466-biopygen66234
MSACNAFDSLARSLETRHVRTLQLRFLVREGEAFAFSSLCVRSPNGGQHPCRPHECAGLYVVVRTEQPNGYPLWKHAALDSWLYSSPEGIWHIGGLQQKGQGFKCATGWMYCPTSHEGRSPHEMTGWKRLQPNGWVTDADIVVVTAPYVAQVTDVDNDGDVRLRNPRGDVSKRFYHEKYSGGSGKNTSNPGSRDRAWRAASRPGPPSSPGTLSYRIWECYRGILLHPSSPPSK